MLYRNVYIFVFSDDKFMLVNTYKQNKSVYSPLTLNKKIQCIIECISAVNK